MLSLLFAISIFAQPLQPIDHGRGCVGNAWPEFNAGFLDLAVALRGGMGGPTSCEFADPNGSGDTLQTTTSGLAFWRKSTNTPTFTDGAQHWALTSRGLVTWSGRAIDPPADAFAGGGQGDPTSYRDYCLRLSEAERADAPICSLVLP